MNKKSVIKSLDSERKFALTGLQETKDASGIFVFYSLLLESLSYGASVDGIDGIPDISKTQTTYLKSGQSPVPDKFIEIAQINGTVANVSAFFSINLILNIVKASQSIVLDGVLALIEGDSSLGKTVHKKLKAWRKEKAPADFLAEAFVLAVRVGKNKILSNTMMEAADEIGVTKEDIDALKERLDKIPKIEAESSPDADTPHEQVYIVALYDAYDDATPDGKTPPSEDITKHPKFEKDLRNRRIEYFAAEAVRRGTRENFRNSDPDNLFADLMHQTHSGVSDVHAMDYEHGYGRLLAVMNHAGNLNLDNTILGSIPTWVGPSQKKGICHILVNEGEIKGWVDDDD
jgi:hypothetical protein